MIELPTLFTVAQIARGLSVDYKIARRRMVQAAGRPELRRVRGQDVEHYSIPTFPPDVQALFRRLAQQRGYASIPHLLVDPPQRWQPKHPLNRLADSGLEKARLRHSVLAPLLAGPDALKVPTSELVRRAQVEFGQMIGIKPPQDLAVREWIDRAFNRDDGWQDWDRLELYLDDDPPLRTVKPTLHREGGDVVGNDLARAISAALLPDTPTEDNLCDVWHAAFTRFCELVDGGLKQSSARRSIVGVLAKSRLSLLPPGASARSKTWTRGLKKWRSGGKCAEALKDGRAGNAREEAFDLSEQETNILLYGRLHKESLNLAVQWLYDHKACRPETRIKIEHYWNEAARRRRPVNWPMSLRRAAEVTTEQEAKLRGEKTFQNVEQVVHRGMWIPGQDGEKIPVVPNMIWESDDMSSNEPFSYLDPDSGEQILIGRQTLATQDVYSRAWLSVMPVGRARDSYRVEDQADHFLETVLASGLPMMWWLERGVWENNMIDGIPLPDGTRWGGLGVLFHVERTFKSRGKGGIETSFDYTQSLQAHDSLSIGRKRGEFEEGTKAMLRAKGGDELAAARFWTIGQYADGIAGKMKEFNATPKQRRAFGRDVVVPNDLYRGAVRKECPASELWRFCPIKKLVTVRRGNVDVSVPHYPHPFCFRVNGEAGNLYLEQGYDVLIAFHPGHPERGCHVFNAERGARNRDNLKFGEFLLLAPQLQDVPQVGRSPDDRELLARKRGRAAVAQEHRSIMASGAPRISISRNGYSKSTRVEHGASGPSIIGGDSIKSQRAAKRRREADDYAQKAIATEAANTARFANLAEREKEAREALGIYD